MTVMEKKEYLLDNLFVVVDCQFDGETQRCKTAFMQSQGNYTNDIELAFKFISRDDARHYAKDEEIIRIGDLRPDAWVIGHRKNLCDYVLQRIDDKGAIHMGDAHDLSVLLFDSKKGAQEYMKKYPQLKGENKVIPYFHDSQIAKLVEKNIRDFELNMTDADRFKRITEWMADTFKAKNHDYGNSFAELFGEYGMTYAVMHLKEKINRIKVLSETQGQVKQESINDSLMDAANYCILTLIELEKKKLGVCSK